MAPQSPQSQASSSRLTPITSSISFARCIDPDAPLFIAKSTIISGILGAALGGTVGVTRSINPAQLAGSMGIRWFVMSSAFFGLREYLVSPLLTANQSTRFHTHQRTELLGESSSVQLTKSDVRTTRLLDSALTGALGGPALVIFRETFTRLGYPGGPRSMLRAGLTCALIASSLQLLVNQTRVLRLDLLARQDGRPLTTPNDSGRPEEKSTSEQVRDSLRNPSRNPEGDKLGDKSLPGRILTTLSTFLPIQKLSDQEYLEALQRKRGEVDTRLAEIEREEGRIYEYATRGNREV